MQGVFGGILTGGLVSVLALSVASVVSEPPAGSTPPAPPQVAVPDVEPVSDAPSEGPNTPVGSVSIEAPVTPDLPEAETEAEPEMGGQASETSPAAQGEIDPPPADTDPLDEPSVVAVEGALSVADPQTDVGVSAEPLAPVLPNPQSLPPQTPAAESDLVVSTTSEVPVLVAEPEGDAAQVQPGGNPAQADDVFVVDLAPATPDAANAQAAAQPVSEAMEDLSPAPESEDLALAVPDVPAVPRLQLQGEGNSLLSDRDTGVVVRRPSEDAQPSEEDAPVDVNALVDFAGKTDDPAGKPLMSVILFDDGSMPAAQAALSGLPFPVTIALDPDMSGVTGVMEEYRSNEVEVAVVAKLPEGAQPPDVEVTFESVFQTLPEGVAVLDLGQGGLQTDRAVTEQAMEILAGQGRGFVTVSQGLNMAGRAAEKAGVPAATVYRDLDADGQDARVIRRFIDQAAFRARQGSGVVLVGRVRPDTISALILWGTANGSEQVALVPLSVVLNAE